MISLKYARDILDFLFATNGSDITYEQECQELTDRGIALSVTGKQVFDSIQRLGDTEEQIKEKFKLRKLYESYRAAINSTVCCECVTDEDSYYSEVIVTNGNPSEVGEYGWKTQELATKRDSAKYPKKRYLALFTTMPNEQGIGYVEPFKGADGSNTTYCRVNLDGGYFSRDQVMADAYSDSEHGGASIQNKETIYYPEISGVDWATEDSPIVGFGIFENKDPVEGEFPYLWGALSNQDAVAAEVNHVPLFRVGDFKISIS
jgi:hypothetical protein